MNAGDLVWRPAVPDAVIAASNRESVALHWATGLELTPGDEVVDGAPTCHDVIWHGFDHVEMAWAPDEGAGG